MARPRLMECLRLRVQDIDFSGKEILVRNGKGAKDRISMLLESLKAPKQEERAMLTKKFSFKHIVLWLIFISLLFGCGRTTVPEARKDLLLPCLIREVVDIKASTDPLTRKQQMKDLNEKLEQGNTIVRLGPDVDLDFSEFPDDFPPDWFPIEIGPCTTLTSVASFKDPRVEIAPRNVGVGAEIGDLGIDIAPIGGRISEARTPRSRGPVLRYGKSRDGAPKKSFLSVRSRPDRPENDHVRISGFRLYGPDFGQQSTDEVGINIYRSVDIEISNMEIAGWGGAGIKIGEDQPVRSEVDTPGRITNFGQIKIHHNFFHHNQHPQKDDHAMGYGVDVGHGAWAQITENVFDFNRHAISAAYDSGGYAAERNLVLKGGGFHGTLFNKTTHSFDVHGSGCWWSEDLCGYAGFEFRYVENAFQYRKANAIKIRGRPVRRAYIANNVFPHPGLEADRGDDAIHLNSKVNVDFGPGNDTKFDSFGKYGVGDFDGDGVDDLFLATGKTWWFSSLGEFHWTYLNAKKERLDQVRLGYFDNDIRCDVLAERNGQWFISSGGSGNWQLLGAFGVPLSEVEFGRFDPSQRDHRPGATRRTTHAFRRAPNGQWFVTPLSSPDWKRVQSSSFPMKKLRFGDFTGDGVTDVLAVENGRWAISESARSRWRRLNPSLGDAVGTLFIANMDPDDNIDDILRLERKIVPIIRGSERVTLTWWRSRNGVEPWRRWKEHVFQYSSKEVTPGFGFAGRFGAASGGGTLVIGPDRLGHFYSEAEIAVGAKPEWTSLFPY